MPENDSTTDVGGPIDFTTQIDFLDLDLASQVQIISSDPDEDVWVTIYGRSTAGFITNEQVHCTGQLVQTGSTFERLMKVQKATSSLGDIVVEKVAAVVEGSVVSVSENSDLVVIDAPSVINDFYRGLIFRVTSGTGSRQVGKVLAYNGSTKEITLDRTVTLDTTSVYRLSRGVLMRTTPHQILTIRRPFYNVIANPPQGNDKYVYEKFFWRNDSNWTLEAASVQEAYNPTGKISFALDPTVPSVSTILNRVTAPNLTFSRDDQAVPTAQSWLHSGVSVAVWLRYSLSAGMSPVKSLYASRLVGQWHN
jgi:hypothetical protein